MKARDQSLVHNVLSGAYSFRHASQRHFLQDQAYILLLIHEVVTDPSNLGLLDIDWLPVSSIGRP